MHQTWFWWFIHVWKFKVVLWAPSPQLTRRVFFISKLKSTLNINVKRTSTAVSVSTAHQHISTSSKHKHIVSGHCEPIIWKHASISKVTCKKSDTASVCCIFKKWFLFSFLLIPALFLVATFNLHCLSFHKKAVCCPCKVFCDSCVKFFFFLHFPEKQPKKLL